MTEMEFTLEALQAGDRMAFARFVDAYSNQIYRLALKMTGNPSDAEDAMQATFLKAFQHLPAFEGRSSLSTWLYRIAVNEVLMMVRKQRPEVPLDGEEDKGQEELPMPQQFSDWCCLPESDLMDGEARRQLEGAIQRLPENLRVVFILRDLEGLSIKETSEALHLSETNVKTRLLRARLNLREQLSAYFAERLPQEGLQ